VRRPRSEAHGRRTERRFSGAAARRSGKSVTTSRGSTPISAQRIIAALIRCKRNFVPRAEFFAKWGRLRKRLYLTKEYNLFLSEVRFRASGMCQGIRCSRKGRHVHHVVRVYDDPSLALDPNNGMFLCVKCHKAIHSRADNERISKTH
jgi:5-methylcytosine-specific restriction endonuclease McrA